MVNFNELTTAFAKRRQEIKSMRTRSACVLIGSVICLVVIGIGAGAWFLNRHPADLTPEGAATGAGGAPTKPNASNGSTAKPATRPTELPLFDALFVGMCLLSVAVPPALLAFYSGRRWVTLLKLDEAYAHKEVLSGAFIFGQEPDAAKFREMVLIAIAKDTAEIFTTPTSDLMPLLQALNYGCVDVESTTDASRKDTTSVHEGPGETSQTSKGAQIAREPSEKSKKNEPGTEE